MDPWIQALRLTVVSIPLSVSRPLAAFSPRLNQATSRRRLTVCRSGDFRDQVNVPADQIFARPQHGIWGGLALEGQTDLSAPSPGSDLQDTSVAPFSDGAANMRPRGSLKNCDVHARTPQFPACRGRVTLCASTTRALVFLADLMWSLAFSFHDAGCQSSRPGDTPLTATSDAFIGAQLQSLIAHLKVLRTNLLCRIDQPALSRVARDFVSATAWKLLGQAGTVKALLCLGIPLPSFAVSAAKLGRVVFRQAYSCLRCAKPADMCIPDTLGLQGAQVSGQAARQKAFLPPMSTVSAASSQGSVSPHPRVECCDRPYAFRRRRAYRASTLHFL